MNHFWIGFHQKHEKTASLKRWGMAGMAGLAALGAGQHNLKASPSPVQPAAITQQIKAPDAARQEIFKLIEQKAKKHNLDPKIFEGLVFAESSFRPKVVNLEGGASPDRRSVGLAQIQPRTAKWLGFQGTKQDLMNPKTNLDYAGKYLARQLKRYGGNYEKALSAYNAGRYIPANRAYVQKILKYTR